MATNSNINKAVCIVHSWLESFGIPVEVLDDASALVVSGSKVTFERRNTPPRYTKPSDLAADEGWCHRCGFRGNVDAHFGWRTPKASGKRIHQSYCRKCRNLPNPIVKDARHFTLDLNALLSNDNNTILKEVHRLTSYLKLGRPGEKRVDHETKVAKHSDYEATSMRLTQFQRTGNPPSAVMAKYKSLVKREAEVATFRYKRTMARMAMEVGDMVTIGMIFFVNHYWTYAVKSTEGIKERFLINYMRQQYARWNTVTLNKLNGIDIGKDMDVSDLVGCPVEGASLARTVQWEESDDGLVAIPTVACSVPEYREEEVVARRVPTKSLNKTLAGMDHDDMVKTLVKLSKSDALDSKTRELAFARLDAHVEGCAHCRHSK